MHRLIEEGSARRRRLLDWGVFHVKHEFLGAWRRYQRALQQRNAVLRAGGDEQLLAAWEHELSCSRASRRHAPGRVRSPAAAVLRRTSPISSSAPRARGSLIAAAGRPTRTWRRSSIEVASSGSAAPDDDRRGASRGPVVYLRGSAGPRSRIAGSAEAAGRRLHPWRSSPSSRRRAHRRRA